MANTLKFGNGNWATKEDSVLAYNDENNNFKPLPFDFTRASTATYVDSDGLIKTSRNGEARIDYTDSTDGALLLEPSRTNSISYSEDFSQWTASDLTVTDNDSTSPDGTVNASKLALASGTSVKRLALGSMPNTAVSRVLSFFVKSDDVSAISLLHSGDLQGFANFNIEDGYVGNTGSKTTAKIKKYPNGWYRCSAIFDSTNIFGSTIYIYIKDDISGSYGGSSSQTGDIYIYGAQYEAGSYPTSYIPTSGSSVTRVAETASGSGNSEVFNDSEGVLFANIAANADDSSERFLSLSNGSSTNRISMWYYSATNGLAVAIYSGNVVQFFTTTVLPKDTLYNKISVKYKQNDFALWVNGFELATDTSGITPIGLSELSFDRGDGALDFYGKTKELAYYDEVLTDLELETLTSYRSWVSMVNELNLNIIYNG